MPKRAPQRPRGPRRVAQAIAAGDVEIDFRRREAHPAARFEHREDHRKPTAVPADRRAPRRGAGRKAHGQRLDLDQHRPRALDRREDAGAADRLAAMREEQSRGIGHLGEPLPFHREHADLVGAAEAVLHRAQDSVLVAALALEAQHRVDHMLEHARAGDRAVLGDMADENDGGAMLLGEADQLLRRGADLADRARRALDQVANAWSGSNR